MHTRTRAYKACARARKHIGVRHTDSCSLELYENDAEVGHKLLGLNYTHGGRDPNSRKMLCAGVPENSIQGTVSKLVALGC